MSSDRSSSGLAGLFFKPKEVVLPSDTNIRVVARQFSVSENWASRTAQLVLESFTGDARVYLNGVKNENLLGTAENYGGGAAFAVEPARLRFDRPNILIIEMTTPSFYRDMPLGRFWPWRKQITGRVRLDSAPETIIASETITFDWQEENSLWVVSAELVHFQFMESGPWTITAILTATDGMEAGRATATLEAEDRYSENITLEFPLVSPHKWRPDDPYLYQLSLHVANSRGEQDYIRLPAGIAKIGTGDGLWQVNGEPVPVRGLYLSARDEFALRSGALPDEWLAAQKAAGYNVIYFYETVPDETWFYAADRLGIGLWTALPARLAVAGSSPAARFRPLLDMTARHPSHWAWTAGVALPPGETTEQYLRQLKAAAPAKPLYLAVGRDEPLRTDGIFTLALHRPLAGSWGSLTAGNVSQAQNAAPLSAWPVRAGAICWFILLLLITLQNIRAKHWRYNDLSKPPRRPMRESCFWLYLAFWARMATIAGGWLLLLCQLPLERLAFVPYDFQWLADLRRQPFLPLWFAAAAVFAAARLIQVGVGAHSFKHKPEAMGLLCWMEKRYALPALAGAAWIPVSFGLPLYLPFALYYGLELLFWPLRLRDARKAGGSNLLLLVCPLTAVFVFIIIIMT
ncbi:MAG: hypothetical protein LBH21_00850 [Gracilibacteraceae bacterium]|nr:hypothetical protein [Gracilibacteraceae bacterium]